jgi:hypothetical protein
MIIPGFTMIVSPSIQLALSPFASFEDSPALDAYQDARRYLLDEIGIEPGVELQELERAILRQDPSLHVPSFHWKPIRKPVK